MLRVCQALQLHVNNQITTQYSGYRAAGMTKLVFEAAMKLRGKSNQLKGATHTLLYDGPNVTHTYTFTKGVSVYAIWNQTEHT